MSNKKLALGKGLSALLSGADEMGSNTITVTKEVMVGTVALVSVEVIDTNPFQVRTEFEEEALSELAQSITELGIIQPVTLRDMENGRFQLISGERRFRASQIAGLREIPAYVRRADDQAMLEMALVENIQREDLNAIEIALSYQRLIEECSLTQEKLSERVAKKRSTITNYLRLLRLPAIIQQGIKEGVISMGHARALVNAEEATQVKLYGEIIQNGLSVRQVEELVRKLQNVDETIAKKSGKDSKFDEQKAEKFNLVGSRIEEILSHPIQIQQEKNGRGKIIIQFESDADLDKIIAFFDSI